MSEFGFLSLPNEILLVVFSHLEDPYPLFPLSTLCRRLHFLALPIYLSRVGVCDSSESCNISVDTEKFSVSLSALQTALFLSAVQNLCCTFSNLDSQHRDLGRLHRLCSILTSIESTNLQFSSSPPNDYTEAIQETYYSSVVDVLNTVLEKSCTTLTVGDIATATSRIPKRARRNKPPYVGALTSSIALSPAALRQKTLSTFRIHSEILLSPHCRAWTLDVLNSFPLTSISIDTPSISTDVWDALFSETEIPTLSELSLLNCRIKPSQMNLFLSRHPSVTSLHLHKVLVPSMGERLPPGYLPQLSVLSAAPAQAAYLLQAMEQTTALRTVRVECHMLRLGLISADNSLRAIASRLALVALSLVLPVPSKVAPYMPDLNLDFGEDSALRFVSKLEFVFADGIVYNVSDYASVAKWVDPFPGLKSVELVGLNGRHDGDMLLKEIRKRAPNVETVVVDGVEHDLTGSVEIGKRVGMLVV
ncbi:hypothetical protein C8R44DRAFT_896049 [Mycena epipterygia]|nr:hypothetical protein C8R44DRAFT_896049 [Mycena epipterygia]